MIGNVEAVQTLLDHGATIDLQRKVTVYAQFIHNMHLLSMLNPLVDSLVDHYCIH